MFTWVFYLDLLCVIFERLCTAYGAHDGCIQKKWQTVVLQTSFCSISLTLSIFNRHNPLNASKCILLAVCMVFARVLWGARARFSDNFSTNSKLFDIFLSFSLVVVVFSVILMECIVWQNRNPVHLKFRFDVVINVLHATITRSLFFSIRLDIYFSVFLFFLLFFLSSFNALTSFFFPFLVFYTFPIRLSFFLATVCSYSPFGFQLHFSSQFRFHQCFSPFALFARLMPFSF